MSMEIGSTTINNIPQYSTSVNEVQTNKTEEDENTKVVEDKNDVNQGVTYEKSEPLAKTTYSINKMSQTERDALVSQLKADVDERQNQLMSLVEKTLNGQIDAFGKASGNEIWRTLASGNFTIDAATKAQALKDIGEDGYWGVKQTSQRLFDFASALAGDDVDQMHKMQKAIEKGFKQATGAWGRDLPAISKNTLDAANKLFEDYYKSKENKLVPVERTAP